MTNEAQPTFEDVMHGLSRILAWVAAAIVVVTMLLLMAACTPDNVRDPPPAPEVIELPVEVYVPIDKALTKRCAWVKSAPISEIFDVARGRKTCLEHYEDQLDAIDQVQGTTKP